MKKDVLLWAVKGWVIPVLALAVLVLPTYLLGYFWLAVVFAGFAVLLGAIELVAMYKTGRTVSSNTALKIRKNPATAAIVLISYLIFSVLLFIHLWTIAFY